MKTTWQLRGLQPYISVAHQWWTREQRPELGLITALALCKKPIRPGVHELPLRSHRFPTSECVVRKHSGITIGKARATITRRTVITNVLPSRLDCNSIAVMY